MGEVTLTDVKYLNPVGVAGPLELAFWADYVVRVTLTLSLLSTKHPDSNIDAVS